MSVARELTILNKVGLHARPAAAFVKTAAGFRCRITVSNLTKGSQAVNAKSLLSLLSIAVMVNDRIQVICEGEDEAAALQALASAVDNRFGEEEV